MRSNRDADGPPSGAGTREQYVPQAIDQAKGLIGRPDSKCTGTAYGPAT